MATSSGWGARPIKPQDRDLICPICLEQLTIPRSLPCLHTFCTECLSLQITKTESKVSGIHTFNCPVCRAVIRLPFSGTPFTTWAEQFSVDIVLASMLPGEKSITDRMCEPCSAQGKQVKAKYFCVLCKEARCQICYEHHKASKSLKYHPILTFKELLSDPAKAVTVAGSLTCTSHGDKEYEFFCSDHDKPLCTTCFMEGHKDCRNYREIRIHAEEVIKELRPNKVLNKMKELEKHLRKVSTMKNQNILDIEANINNQLCKISTLRQTIHSIMEGLERRVVEEGKKIIKEQMVKKMNEDIQIQSLIAAIKNSCKTLETISNYGSETQVCVVLQKMEDQLLTYQTKTVDYSEILKINIHLNVPDCKGDISMLPVTDLFAYTVSESRQTIPVTHDTTQSHANDNTAEQIHKQDIHITALTSSDHNDAENMCSQVKDIDRAPYRPVKCSEIVKISDFKIYLPMNCNPPVYSGIACLPDDKFVFLDYSNSRCCLYDSHYQYLSEYRLTSQPRCMSIVAKNEIAVSLPDEMKIHFLLVGATITLKRLISTKRWYTLIASLNSKELVFTGYQQDRYHWGVLKINGQEKSCFYIPRQNQSSSGTYLTLNSEKTRVYISCAGNNAVYCFDLDGHKYFEYMNDDLQAPNGMAIDTDENIFIVGCNSHNIHQLSQDGSLLQVISFGIPKFPSAICFTNSKEQFLLTNYDNINRDTIFVYQVK